MPPVQALRPLTPPCFRRLFGIWNGDGIRGYVPQGGVCGPFAVIAASIRRSLPRSQQICVCSERGWGSEKSSLERDALVTALDCEHLPAHLVIVSSTLMRLSPIMKVDVV